MVAEAFPLRGECIRVLDSGSITVLLGLPEVDRPKREQKRTFQAVCLQRSRHNPGDGSPGYDSEKATATSIDSSRPP